MIEVLFDFDSCVTANEHGLTKLLFLCSLPVRPNLALYKVVIYKQLFCWNLFISCI
jgi:hypothetical protein